MKDKNELRFIWTTVQYMIVDGNQVPLYRLQANLIVYVTLKCSSTNFQAISPIYAQKINKIF